uniref:Uncharacterized protein n=1 Tax=Knipowitschia caucasica TaxID=637954 RepID=A0AAV2M2P3_KNICA
MQLQSTEVRVLGPGHHQEDQDTIRRTSRTPSGGPGHHQEDQQDTIRRP